MNRTAELRERGLHDRSDVMPNSARELLVASVGSDPYERIEDLRRCGERKARAEGVAYQLEAETKSMLARLANEYAHLHADQHLSEARLERMSRADPRYTKHIAGVAAAIEERELAQSEYWAIRSELEWDRAALAHVNAVSRLGEP